MMESARDDSDSQARMRLDRFLAGAEARAFRMARLATRNDEEALDIVQDAMLGFARRYASKPEEEWPPLFHTVLNSRILDWHRKQKVRRRWRVFFQRDDDEADPLEQAPDLHETGPAGELEQDQCQQVVQQALAALPPRQRQAFLLRNWEGYSVAETARIMGCGEGSVKTHLSRALKALREQLQELNHE